MSLKQLLYIEENVLYLSIPPPFSSPPPPLDHATSFFIGQESNDQIHGEEQTFSLERVSGIPSLLHQHLYQLPGGWKMPERLWTDTGATGTLSRLL